MACTFVRVASAAGSRISAIWDAVIVNNDKWSCFDPAAGTNAKVYRCYDSAKSVDFYVYVDDNQADYSIIQLWEGWDAEGHAGIGDSITLVDTYELRLFAVYGTYVIVNDHRVIIATAWNHLQCYIGQLKRIDESKNMPIYIGRTTGTTYYNPLGFQDSSSSLVWRALFNHVGAVGKIIHPAGRGSAYLFSKTIAGTHIFQETDIYDNDSKLVLGQLDGACYIFSGDKSFNNGEIISCEDGDWLVQGGSYTTKYWAAVRLV